MESDPTQADDEPAVPRAAYEPDLDWADAERGSRFAFRRKQLGSAAGGRELGCSLYEVPPGKRPWPTHYHEGNEEALYVLSGSGTLHTRDGADNLELRPDTYVALPAGADYVRQVENDGDAPLRYLALSTMNHPDVSVYPDSDKVGVFCGSAPGGKSSDRTLHEYFPRDAAVGYWDGEPTDEE
ncbi:MULTISPECIES: cupin domain-containing protein [Haloferax]|uniref:Cupin domain-containing protein n=2 Tax=Haloferax TaxID=2251 RepID=A0A6G1YY10_9EURY|nr:MULTISPECIES: cupin domain-containing protein [Haloferax]KAB1186560.1 cupin domain-containing protein [Haloferax sp. CBA1149]MRW79172.1 cupin domain-containing protein [Haloferax marinisediminis]